MHRSVSALAGVALSLGLLAALPSAAEAAAADTPCTDVEVVYARGAGQSLRAMEAIRFRDQLAERIQEPLTMQFYEVGTEAIGGYQYPAVAVGDPRTLVGAFTTAGEANEYGASVDAGAAEMLMYLMQRRDACPESRFVLGGYSQGAQVVGEILGGAQYFMAGNIDFVALFGDPKL